VYNLYVYTSVPGFIWNPTTFDWLSYLLWMSLNKA